VLYIRTVSDHYPSWHRCLDYPCASDVILEKILNKINLAFGNRSWDGILCNIQKILYNPLSAAMKHVKDSHPYGKTPSKYI
jgi:hypothetical protein